MSKPKGLKDHKKAQKEKAMAKRAAAAAGQAKAKKGSKVEKKVDAVAEDTARQAVTSPAEKIIQEKVKIAIVQDLIAEDTVTPHIADIGVVDEDVCKYKSAILHPARGANSMSAMVSQVDEVPQEKPVIAVVLVAQDTCEYKSAIIDYATVANTISAMVAEKIDEDISEKISIPTITVKAPSTTDTIPQDTEVAASVTIAQDELAAKATATAAHRKKLEADLYDGMESAQKCFARINGVNSATAEYNDNVVDVVYGNAVSDSSLADAASERAADDTGIEYVAVHNAAAYTPENILQDAVIPEATDVVVDDVATVPSNEPETPNNSITWAQLLFSTANAGASTVSAPRANSPLTLAEVEKMQADAKASNSSSLDINQLFAAGKAERAIAVRMPKAVAASTVPEITQLFAVEGAPIIRPPPARNWAPVVAGMTFGCMDKIADDESPVEPVVIGGRSRTPVDRKLIEAVVLGRPEELADVSKVSSPVLEGNANDKPVPRVLQVGSEKLMSMLGVDGRVSTPVPTQQNGQEGTDKFMALLGYPRLRTTSGSTVPTPPQLSPVMNGRRSTPNTDVTITPPPLDDGLAKSNTHNFSKNDCVAGQGSNMGASSVPYDYQNLGAGPQYPAAQYAADPFFHEYHLYGLPGFPTPFYGQWHQHSQGYARW